MKKQSISLIVLVVMAFVVCRATAEAVKTPPVLAGTWALNGSGWLKADLVVTGGPNKGVTYLTANITFPTIMVVGEEFTFGVSNAQGQGSFTDAVFGISGSDAGAYTESGSGKFTADISTWLSSIQAELLSLVTTYEPGAVITVTQTSVKGGFSGNEIKGAIKIGITVALPSFDLAAPLTLDIMFSGKKVFSGVPGIANSNSAESAARMIFDKFLLPFLK